MDNDKYEVGLQRMRELMGDRADLVVEKLKKISPDFARYTVEFPYGEIGNRKIFSNKEREMAIVACLIARGNTGSPLRSHLTAMLKVGWTKEEVIELILLLTVYAGFPAAVDAINVFSEIIES